jgi:hypothetical protein
MKALSHIALLIALVLSSCTPALYTGAEYDDLYYSAADKPVVTERTVVSTQTPEKELKANEYYDNVYAADTLVTDKYSVPSDYDDQVVVNNSNMSGSGYDYYDDSYANRINMFYGGNYFNPYWQDPFYMNFGYNYGYPYFGFGLNFGYGFGIGFGWGYGGYPYYGYPYYGYGYYPYYDPYYYYGGGYYGYPYYGGGYYHYDDHNSPSYGRRERPSNLSSNYNDNLGLGGSRRSSGSSGVYSTSGGRTNSGSQGIAPDTRRSAAGMTTGSTGRVTQDVVKNEGASARSASSSSRTVVNSRPDYKSSNRTYTPSYNNPRMSTRPSYNNSRVYEGTGSNARQGNSSTGGSRNFNSTAPVRNSQNRVMNQSSGNGQKANSFSNMQRRYSTPSSSSRSYSAPSKRSFGSSGGYSSGSSGRSSSYSGGSSSGSGSRSSYSGGSSSSGSSGGRSSSSSHSSGGRR